MKKFIKSIGNPSIWLRDTLFRGDADYMLHTAAGTALGFMTFDILILFMPFWTTLLFSVVIGLLVGVCWELMQGLVSTSKFDKWDVFYTWVGFLLVDIWKIGFLGVLWLIS